MSLEKGAFFPLTCKRVVVVVVVVVVVLVVPFRGHTLPCHLRQCHFSAVQIQGEILGPGETVILIFTESFFFGGIGDVWGAVKLLILLMLDES